MTTAVISAPRRSGLIALPWSSAAGECAKVLGEIHQDVRLHLLNSLSLRSAAQEALDELEEARKEACVRGWNGERTEPIDPEAYMNARAFIQALPTTVPKPEIGIDTDGEVSIDWLFGSGLTLSVSIGKRGRLTFASLLGMRAIQGTEWLTDGIPAAILDELTAVAGEARLARLL